MKISIQLHSWHKINKKLAPPNIRGTQGIADAGILSKRQSGGGTQWVKQYMWREWIGWVETLQTDGVGGKEFKMRVDKGEANLENMDR